MRVTTKGQVTIPQDVREQLGILPGTEVEIYVRGNHAQIVKAGKKSGKVTRGERIAAQAAGKGTANVDLTTDQILELTRGWEGNDPDR